MAFDFKFGTAGIGHTKIQGWVVWFLCPFGLYEHLEEAVIRCQECDIDPNLGISPVPVAIWKSMNGDQDYEVFKR